MHFGILLATKHFTNWSTNDMPSRDQFNSCWNSATPETDHNSCLQDPNRKTTLDIQPEVQYQMQSDENHKFSQC